MDLFTGKSFAQARAGGKRESFLCKEAKISPQRSQRAQRNPGSGGAED